jgi:hypothetical protein
VTVRNYFWWLVGIAGEAAQFGCNFGFLAVPAFRVSVIRGEALHAPGEVG